MALYAFKGEPTKEEIPELAAKIIDKMMHGWDLVDDPTYQTILVDYENGNGYQVPQAVMDFMTSNGYIKIDKGRTNMH